MNVSEFINSHKSEDVRQLAFLAAKFPDIDMPWHSTKFVVGR